MIATWLSGVVALAFPLLFSAIEGAAPKNELSCEGGWQAGFPPELNGYMVASTASYTPRECKKMVEVSQHHNIPVYAWSLSTAVIESPYSSQYSVDGSRAAAIDTRGLCMIWFKPVTTLDNRTQGYRVTGKMDASKFGKNMQYLEKDEHTTCYMNTAATSTSWVVETPKGTCAPGCQLTSKTLSCLSTVQEERGTGHQHYDEDDLHLFSKWNDRHHLIGLQFEPIDIPEGATITSAKMSFLEQYSIYNGPVIARFRGVTEARPRPFGGKYSPNGFPEASGVPFDLSNRHVTEAEALWWVEWRSESSDESSLYSPNLAEVMQEMLDRQSGSTDQDCFEPGKTRLYPTFTADRAGGCGQATLRNHENAMDANENFLALQVQYCTCEEDAPAAVPTAALCDAGFNTGVPAEWLDYDEWLSSPHKPDPRFARRVTHATTAEECAESVRVARENGISIVAWAVEGGALLDGSRRTECYTWEGPERLNVRGLVDECAEGRADESVCHVQHEVPCVFPFMYGGVKYDSCAPPDALRGWGWGPHGWCPTVVSNPDAELDITDWQILQPCAPKGSACKFPFTFDGILHQGCSLLDSTRTYWCPFSDDALDEDGNYMDGREWGYCELKKDSGLDNKFKICHLPASSGKVQEFDAATDSYIAYCLKMAGTEVPPQDAISFCTSEYVTRGSICPNACGKILAVENVPEFLLRGKMVKLATTTTTTTITSTTVTTVNPSATFSLDDVSPTAQLLCPGGWKLGYPNTNELDFYDNWTKDDGWHADTILRPLTGCVNSVLHAAGPDGEVPTAVVVDNEFLVMHDKVHPDYGTADGAEWPFHGEDCYWYYEDFNILDDTTMYNDDDTSDDDFWMVCDLRPSKRTVCPISAPFLSLVTPGADYGPCIGLGNGATCTPVCDEGHTTTTAAAGFKLN
eukprot:gene6689-9827_t